MVNILIDRLPETVEIGDMEYPIRTDFRVSILFELLMQDDTVPDSEKTMQAIRLYYPEPPEDTIGALDKLIWFYGCGRDKEKGEKQENHCEEDENWKEELVYSFEYDDRYIYAAFMSEYGIDLQDVQHLHWWKFRALFVALKEDCELKKIMGYRSIRISSSMSSEQRDFYEKMKSIYALPRPQSEQDKYDAVVSALMGDGNLEGLL